MRGGYIIVDAGTLELNKIKKFNFPDGFVPDDSKTLYIRFNFDTNRGRKYSLFHMNYVDGIETEKEIGGPVTAFIYYTGVSIPSNLSLEIVFFANSFYITLSKPF